MHCDIAKEGSSAELGVPEPLGDSRVERWQCRKQHTQKVCYQNRCSITNPALAPEGADTGVKVNTISGLRSGADPSLGEEEPTGSSADGMEIYRQVQESGHLYLKITGVCAFHNIGSQK